MAKSAISPLTTKLLHLLLLSLSNYFAVTILVAEFPGPKKVNLCVIIGLYISEKVTGYLPSY